MSKSAWPANSPSDKLCQSVLQLRPDWICLDNYFCLPPASLFLCGFTPVQKSWGGEINIFAVPLFANELKFNLNYADNLPSIDDAVVTKGRSTTDIASDFVSKTEALVDQARNMDSLGYFLRRIEKDALFRNTRIAFDYGLALVLARRFEEAAHHLSNVGDCEWENRVVPEEAKCARSLAAKVRTSPETALETVQGFLQQHRQYVSEITRPR